MLLTLLHFMSMQPQHSWAEFVFMMEWASSVGRAQPHVLSSLSVAVSSLPQSASLDPCCSTSTLTPTLWALDSRPDTEPLVSIQCSVFEMVEIFWIMVPCRKAVPHFGNTSMGVDGTFSHSICSKHFSGPGHGTVWCVLTSWMIWYLMILISRLYMGPSQELKCFPSL